MAIDKTVKDAFRDFCINNFPGRIIECNDNDDYIRVQAGNHFKDFLHYEYRNNNDFVEFHIEFDEKKENYSFHRILSSFGGCKNLEFNHKQLGYYEWGHLNTHNSLYFNLTTKTTAGNMQPIFDQFNKLQREVEPCLREIEFFIRKYWNF